MLFLYVGFILPILSFSQVSTNSWSEVVFVKWFKRISKKFNYSEVKDIIMEEIDPSKAAEFDLTTRSFANNSDSIIGKK